VVTALDARLDSGPSWSTGSRLAQIFNNDSTLTSAILDRVLHHAETVIIEGKSFRMKDEIEE
jgi:DNA replication protein DnaC